MRVTPEMLDAALSRFAKDERFSDCVYYQTDRGTERGSGRPYCNFTLEITNFGMNDLANYLNALSENA